MCLANPALETGLESQLWLGETPAAETEGVSSEGGPSPGGRGTWQLCSPRWRGGNGCTGSSGSVSDLAPQAWG